MVPLEQILWELVNLKSFGKIITRLYSYFRVINGPCTKLLLTLSHLRRVKWRKWKNQNLKWKRFCNRGFVAQWKATLCVGWTVHKRRLDKWATFLSPVNSWWLSQLETRKSISQHTRHARKTSGHDPQAFRIVKGKILRVNDPIEHFFREVEQAQTSWRGSKVLALSRQVLVDSILCTDSQRRINQWSQDGGQQSKKF